MESNRRPEPDRRPESTGGTGSTRRTMREVSHLPPYDDALTGGLMFSRGRTLATDGGGRLPARAGSPSGRETMADVDHTPPDGDGARRVWDRGLPKPGVHVAGEP